jgi:hypothetical protein
MCFQPTHRSDGEFLEDIAVGHFGKPNPIKAELAARRPTERVSELFLEAKGAGGFADALRLFNS